MFLFKKIPIYVADEGKDFEKIHKKMLQTSSTEEL
jgi:hypothetical protein